MALANSVGAIAAVTEAVTLRLHEMTGLDVTVGRPEPATSVTAVKRLNVFLYELQFDSALKNVPLDEGQQPPLWLVLKYLLTAFEDDGKTSDSLKAYDNLGLGIRALQELTFLPLAPLTRLDAVIDNPQDLKITFDEAPLDMLSKVMQGSDEKYRLSVAFQVRPVLIAPAALPSYSLLVGVDYTATPVTTIGEKGIQIPVIPSLGPTITEISPEKFELGATVTIKGTDLHLSNLSVNLGPINLPVTMQRPDELRFVVREDIATSDVISAGSHAISVSQLLPTGRRRASNVLVGSLLPSLSAAAIFGAIGTVAVAPPPVGWRFATIDITGKLLGKNDVDDFYLALYRDGKTFAMLDVQNDTSPPGAPQTQRRFAMAQTNAVPPGKYLVIYRVNGQQSPQGFAIDLT
jgi:Pvc16 N-terminal domain/IPT/TIG domain